MNGFFHKYSYNIVKNLVNQFAISLFGAMLSMVTTAAGNTGFAISVSIFAIVFYLFLVYTTTWEIGAKDRVSVDVGKMDYKPHTGLLIALVSNIPNFFIATMYFVSSLFPDTSKVAGTINFLSGIFSMIFQGMYTGLLMSIRVSETDFLINMWWAFFLIIIPGLVTSWIAYYTGFKNFRILAQFFDKKTHNKK